MGKIFKGITLPKDDVMPKGEQLDEETIKTLKRKDVNIQAPVLGMKIK